MGHGDDGRAKENPAASGEQDRRAVDAAALATAQAQLAAAEAGIELTARQFAEAAARREQERAQERAQQEERRKELRGKSVEELAQDKALAREISQIKDPEQRAEAQRLLSEIKQEATGRAASEAQAREQDRGRGYGDD